MEVWDPNDPSDDRHETYLVIVIIAVLGFVLAVNYVFFWPWING
jgi:hypothetical protein